MGDRFVWEDGNGLHNCSESGRHEVHKCTCGVWWPVGAAAVHSGNYEGYPAISQRRGVDVAMTIIDEKHTTSAEGIAFVLEERPAGDRTSDWFLRVVRDGLAGKPLDLRGG